MIIVEDAPNQLPPELEGVEDHIVATYHVHYDDIIEIANGYVQNCICDSDEQPAGFNCFGENCTLERSFQRDSQMTLWHSWDTTKCPDGELNVTCVRENCNFPTTDDSFHQRAISCAEQAEFFFRNPDGYDSPGSMILVVNGQLEPTLNITADTWVRLRLGYMATQQEL